MTTHRHCLIALAFAALVLTGPAAAENVDLGKLVTDSLKAMNESRWEDALADLNTATAPFAKGIADDYGPQFGVLCINRCIAHFKLGNIPEGNENLAIAIANRENFPTADATIVAGFQALVGAAIENNKSLEADRRGITSPDLTKLAATACLHEVNGNTRGAFAAYEQLELYYPKAEKREDNLFNLVRTASFISEVFATEKYGRLFLKTYPQSKYAPQVRRTLLSSLWKDHAEGSAYRTQMTVAQWPALDAVGRGGEGLDRLWGIVMELAQAADPSGLEPALNSFVGLYLKKHTLAELREFLFNGPTGHQPELRAVLRMALILGFESALADGTQKPEDKIKLEALVNVLFRELKSDFTLATLTPYILLRVGNHLATGSPPREALPYYDEINRRKDATYQTEALLRRGGVNARSDEPAHLDEAIADFDRVINLAEDKSLRERAIYEKVKADSRGKSGLAGACGVGKTIRNRPGHPPPTFAKVGPDRRAGPDCPCGLR